MSRLSSFVLALWLAGSAHAVMAQTASQPVEVTPLAAPDAFTTPGRATGLPPELWAGASARTARTVLPLLAARSLSPAGAALARRILATGAPGPAGSGRDPALAAARANALMFQGDPKAAAAVLAHVPGLDRSSELARAAAESALLSGDDPRACQIADGLTAGRDETYWLKLRGFCQAIAGQSAQARLTFELAQGQVKDPIFTRLMGARLAGVGNPGPASLRNGLDFALSRALGLDLTTARPSPAVAAALATTEPGDPVFDLAVVPADLTALAGGVAKGRPPRDADVMALISGTQAGEPRLRAQAAVLLALVLERPLSPDTRNLMAGLSLPEGKAPVGRNLALESAAQLRLMGETALLSLWTCAEAGPAGPVIGDRVRIVQALHAVGLEADARAFALEGLVALK